MCYNLPVNVASATNERVLYTTVKYGNEERAILILPMQPVGANVVCNDFLVIKISFYAVHKLA